MKETVNWNTQEYVINLLKKITLHWAQKMDDIVDTVHQVGRKEEKRTCQIIVQFVKHQQRDGFWRMTKESEMCKQAGVQFSEDLNTADKQAREALWLKIQDARKAGDKAYFHGPFGFISSKRI